MPAQGPEGPIEECWRGRGCKMGSVRCLVVGMEEVGIISKAQQSVVKERRKLQAVDASKVDAKPP